MAFNPIDRLKKSKNLQNVLRISSGTLVGQAINVVTIPMFTRLYGDEIIGGWAFLNTIAMVVIAISDLGLTNALMMENEGEDQHQTYRVVTTLVIAFSLVAGLGIFVYLSIFPGAGVGISALFSAVFLALAVFTLQQIQICYTWLNRAGQYTILMKNPVITNATFGLFSVILALVGVRAYGYYLGWLAGQICTLIHMRRYLPKGFITLQFDDFRQVVARNSHYVRYQWPNNALLQFKGQLPSLLLKSMFGAGILGQYAITVRLVNIPVTFLGNAMGRVFFQVSSDMKRAGQPLGEFALRNLKRAMKLAAVPVLLVIAAGDVVLNIVLGEGWQMAGTMIRILAVQAFFLFLSMSVQGISMTLNKQLYTMINSVVQVVTIALSLGIGYYIMDSIYPGLIMMSVSSVVITILYFIALFRAMQVSAVPYVRSTLLSLLLIFLGAFLIRLPLYWLGIAPTL